MPKKVIPNDGRVFRIFALDLDGEEKEMWLDLDEMTARTHKV